MIFMTFVSDLIKILIIKALYCRLILHTINYSAKYIHFNTILLLCFFSIFKKRNEQ
ncbi:hypothetical protein D3C85_322380 [compost metagenome]